MVESVAEMAGKRKTLSSPSSPGKPQKKVKTEQVTTNKAKNQKNAPKKTIPKGKLNEQQAKKKDINAPPVSQNANKNAGETTPVRKTFSKRKFRDFVKDAITGEVKPEEALTKIQEQINKIQTSDDLSNTAKRKLSKLYSIADKIQKQTGINKIDIAKQKSLKPVSKILPKTENKKPNLTKPIKKEDNANNKNKASQKVDQSEDESEELEEDSVEGEDDSEDGEEEEEDSQVGEEDSEGDEEDSGEEEEMEGVDSAEGSDDDEDEDDDDADDDDDDGENNEEVKEEKTVQIKTNEKKTVEVRPDKTKQVVDDFTIFAGNIPFESTEDQVKEHFLKVGEVVSVVIPKQKKDGKSRGFAIIQMKDKESYDKGLTLHYTNLNGRQIYVRQFHQIPLKNTKESERKPKQFGNQGKQFNPNHRQQGGGFNPRNRRPMQKGDFKPKNKRDN